MATKTSIVWKYVKDGKCQVPCCQVRTAQRSCASFCHIDCSNVLVEERPFPEVKSIKGQLKDEKGKPLKRFEHIIDAHFPDFDPRFIVSIAIGPYTSFVLSESAEQLLPFTKSSVNSILEAFNNYNYSQFYAKTVQQENVAPSPAKRPRRLFSFGSRTQTSGLSVAQVPKEPLFVEFEKFYEVRRLNDDLKTAEFWLAHKNDYLQIYDIAQRLLVIPATSASVEWLVSFMTIHIIGNKCNSKAELIERKVLSSFNKKFLDC